MIDFDDIDDWAPNLVVALSTHITESVRQELRAAAPEFIEDALDLLFSLTNRDAVIDAMLVWIQSIKVAGYHGSRLTDAEIISVREKGLIPMKAAACRNRLARALQPYPRWCEVKEQLDSTIQDHGLGGAAGRREGQVHLTLSRSGLANDFNHYLTHGSEFDQRVAYALLGPEGVELLSHYGKSVMIQVAVPGSRALDASHPHFDIDDMRARGDVPNLVNEFLKAWSYQLAYTEFQSRTLEIDCGMVFHSAVPTDWIKSIEIIVRQEG